MKCRWLQFDRGRRSSVIYRGCVSLSFLCGCDGSGVFSPGDGRAGDRVGGWVGGLCSLAPTSKMRGGKMCCTWVEHGNGIAGVFSENSTCFCSHTPSFFCWPNPASMIGWPERGGDLRHLIPGNEGTLCTAVHSYPRSAEAVLGLAF